MKATTDVAMYRKSSVKSYDSLVQLDPSPSPWKRMLIDKQLPLSKDEEKPARWSDIEGGNVQKAG